MRKSWENYYMDMAYAVATRGTCQRKQVGCVIVVGKEIWATGYNGSMPGKRHCSEVGCHVVKDHCIRTIHAEINALEQYREKGWGRVMSGGVMYTTTQPCINCVKSVAVSGTGIRRIYYAEAYGDSISKFALDQFDMELIKL